MNKPVSFELAKLLKEKKYEEPCNKYYEFALTSKKNEEDGYGGPFGWKKGELNRQEGYHVNNRLDNSNKNWLLCSAPTIADVVMWLYEKYGIWIYPKREDEIINNEAFDRFSPIIEFVPQTQFDIDDLGKFKTPIEAYETAIEYTLNNLL